MLSKIDKKPRSHILPLIMIGLSMLFIIYNYFVQVAPSVMTQPLMRAYSIDASGLGLLGSLFLFAYAFMQIPAGLLLDRFGARRMLSLAIFISGVGVCLFALSHTFLLAGFSRVLAGGGAAFSFLGGLYIAARWFKHKHFALIAGSLQLGAGIGSIVGEAPLSFLVNHYGWRGTTLRTGVVMLLLSSLFWFIIRDHPSDAKSSPDKTKLKTSLAAVFRHKQVWFLAFYNFVTWVPAGAVGALWGVPYLMRVYGWTNTQAGEAFIALWISVGLMAPIIGWFSDFIGKRLPILLVSIFIGLVGSGILLFAADLSPALVVIGLFLLGIPGASQSAAFATVKDNVPSDHYGAASAICNMATLLGGAIGQLAIAFLVAWHWMGTMAHDVPVYSTSDFKTGLLLLPILFIVCFFTTWLAVKETGGRQMETPFTH